ncbi:MAG: zinc-ribbon domain-containing protein [Clostridiales Family XIII bacterium]|jgi:uncharacterized membrane protein|nr:zinc-ribbon domain-containing protein [Clostridiales Family XIII bacterium]
MAFCTNCGTQTEDGVRFCPSCGTEIGATAAPQQTPPQAPESAQPQQPVWRGAPQPGAPTPQGYAAPGQGAPGGQPAYGAPSDWASDAQQNKVWGVLAYILFLIPLLAGPKNSQYTRYHTNQGLSFFIVWVVIVIVLNIVSAIVTAAMFSGGGLGLLYGYGWGGLVIFSIIGTVLGIIFAIIGIIGIVHAVKGEKKPLPIVGKINILKVQ